MGEKGTNGILLRLKPVFEFFLSIYSMSLHNLLFLVLLSKGGYSQYTSLIDVLCKENILYLLVEP